MFDSRVRRLLGGVALAAMLLLPAAGVAAATSDCAVTVSPASGPPGTQFTLTGSGYTATAFSLTQGKTTKTVTVDLAGADPWTYAFVAADSDVGRWKVTAFNGDSQCTGVANIHVTLPSTSTLDPATSDKTVALAAIVGMVLVFGVSAAFVFRRSRPLA